jgi:hypothetical protein
MRRVPAILLLAVFSYSLIGAALWADADSRLPACCRRDGKHHCAMMNMDQGAAEAQSPGLAVRAVTTRCPFFPKGGAVLPHSGAALLTGAPPARVAVLYQMAAPAQAAAGYRFSFDRSHQKRGPPSLFS